MLSGKFINIFNPQHFFTSGVFSYGLEAIRTKFVGQPKERVTV